MQYGEATARRSTGLTRSETGQLELEYGWIKPGRFLDRTGKLLSRLWKRSLKNRTKPLLVKPEPPAACGIRWYLQPKEKNLEFGMEVLSRMMSRFERLKEAIDTAEELKVLDGIYEAMPRRNFSSHLLQCVPERLQSWK